MNHPLVSITSAFYNTGPALLDMVKSIFAQTFTDWELVMLDDGSTDNSFEIAGSVVDDRVRIFRNERNLGIPASLNKIPALCRGKYIARMDSDDMCVSTRIAKQVEFLESHSDVDMVGTGVVYLDRANHPIGKGPARALSHEQVCFNPYRGIRICHSSMLGKKKWFEQHNYDESLPRSSDSDFILRAHEDSRYANIPDNLFYYRLSSSFNLRKQFICRHYDARSIINYSLKHGCYGEAIKSFITTYMKYAIEVGMCGLGMRERLFSLRYEPLSKAEEEFHSAEVNRILCTQLPLNETAVKHIDNVNL
jgi:glycosyltransferase involved in cell wall biosynthesis